MNVWEEAILRCINSFKGEADLQQIYRHIGSFIDLTQEHWKTTQWGGRSAYEHQIRSHVSNLCQAGDLIKISRGRYQLTEDGKRRIGA